MQRVMITGGPGSGKSTLARALGDRTGVPVYHMDHIHHLPDWVQRPRAERIKMANAIEARNQWIFEGFFQSTFDNRAARADTLIWLDLPMPLRLWRVLARLVRTYGTRRPDMAEGCIETLGPHTVEFVHWIITTRKRHRQRVQRLIADHGDTLEVHHFRRQRDVDVWLDAIDAKGARA